MKRAIYYITQRVLFGKQERQLIFSRYENLQVSLAKITFSSEFLSNPSPIMRMRCCSMSC